MTPAVPPDSVCRAPPSVKGPSPCPLRRTNLPHRPNAASKGQAGLVPSAPSQTPSHPLPYPHAHLERNGPTFREAAPAHTALEEGPRIRLPFFANRIPCLESPLSATDSKSNSNGPWLLSSATTRSDDAAPPPQDAGAGLALKDDDAMPSPTSTAQSPAVAHRPQGVGAGLALPSLLPFVGFGPLFAQAVGPRSARALPDTVCSHFSAISTPPAGPLGPHRARAWQLRLCLLLSTCPSRLNPKLRRDLPGTGSRKKRAAQFNTNQIAVAP